MKDKLDVAHAHSKRSSLKIRCQTADGKEECGHCGKRLYGFNHILNEPETIIYKRKDDYCIEITEKGYEETPR